MPKEHDYIKQFERLEKRLEEITSELHAISVAANTIKENANAELGARLARLNQMLQAPHHRAIDFLSGRWPRRDGDGYATNAQPPTETEPGPDAHNPPGNLRPADER